MTVLGTLLEVLAGGVLTRRTQERHWLKDTRAEACTAVLMEAVLHQDNPSHESWLRLQRQLIDEQMAFVNTARQSLDRTQSRLTVRVGGPPTAELI